jgi:hypothetical protein
MNEGIDWKLLFTEARARIYLLWAAITGVGFTATHYALSDKAINGFWIVLSFIGLAYMYKVMPMRLGPAKRIFNAWLWPISFGIAVSIGVFYIDAGRELIPYLGAFWLFVMAVGYVLNGLADPPSEWYWIAAVLSVVAGLAIFFAAGLLSVQWLIAAIVSVWSMLNLWLFRSHLL